MFLQKWSRARDADQRECQGKLLKYFNHMKIFYSTYKYISFYLQRDGTHASLENTEAIAYLTLTDPLYKVDF